jgi:hypothetical protein
MKGWSCTDCVCIPILLRRGSAAGSSCVRRGSPDSAGAPDRRSPTLNCRPSLQRHFRSQGGCRSKETSGQAPVRDQETRAQQPPRATKSCGCSNTVTSRSRSTFDRPGGRACPKAGEGSGNRRSKGNYPGPAHEQVFIGAGAERMSTRILHSGWPRVDDDRSITRASWQGGTRTGRSRRSARHPSERPIGPLPRR